MLSGETFASENSILQQTYLSGRFAMNLRFGKDFGIFVAVNSDLEIAGKNEQAFQNRETGTAKDIKLGDSNCKLHTYWSFGFKF